MGLNNTEAIEAALDRVVDEYIFADKAVETAEFVRGRLAAGDYQALEGEALCEAVTADLQKVHRRQAALRLLWNEKPQPLLEEEDDEDDERRFVERSRARESRCAPDRALPRG